MTKTFIQKKEELKAEFQKEWSTGNLEFTYDYGDIDRPDIPKITDWWFNKFQEYNTQLLERVEGMRIKSTMKPKELSVNRIEYEDGFNKAVDTFIKLLKE